MTFMCVRQSVRPSRCGIVYKGTKTKNKTKMKNIRPKTKTAENDQIRHFQRRKRKGISVGLRRPLLFRIRSFYVKLCERKGVSKLGALGTHP